MKKSKLFLFTLVMAIVMMAMSPATMWAVPANICSAASAMLAPDDEDCEHDECYQKYVGNDKHRNICSACEMYLETENCNFYEGKCRMCRHKEGPVEGNLNPTECSGGITVLRGVPNSDNEGYAKLFDESNNTKWCGSSIDCHVIFKLSESKKMTGYTFVDGGDTNEYTGRHWKAWAIYGANFTSDEAATRNASGWIQVDNRSNSDYSSSGTSSFNISDAAAYKYYKIEIDEVGATYNTYFDEEEDRWYHEYYAQQMAEVQFTWAAADSGEGGGETTTPALTTGVNQVSIGEGETATYSFTPTESGFYHFFSWNNVHADLNLLGIELGEEEITIFGIDDVNVEQKDFDNIAALTEGNTYKVSITCLSGPAENYPVFIYKSDSSLFTYTATKDLNELFISEFNAYCGEWKDPNTPVTGITKSGISRIGDDKFNDCEELTSISLPNSVAVIYRSFYNCTNLASISCPSSLTEIFSSFEDCENLNNVHLSSIPHIDENHFNDYVITIDLTDDSYVAEDMGSYPDCSEDSGITYTREMSNQWGTVVLPFGLNYDSNNGNYKLYHLTKATDAALTFTEYNDEDYIDPGTPMVIKALDNTQDTDLGKYVVTIEETYPSLETEINATDDVDGLSMKGTFKETTIGGTEGNGVYFIANNSFYRADVATTVKPFRGWFEFSSGSDAKSFDIVVEENGETTAIGVLNAENLELRDGKFLENNRIVIVKNGKKYNLNGQEVK